MADVYLVACAKTKQTRASSAQDMYISPLFTKARHLARLRADRWYILSAKYGLLDPSRLIEPYEETLKRMSGQGQRDWADRVLLALKAVIQPGDKVVLLAGCNYRKLLISDLRRMGCTVECPLEGLPIGCQLKWLNDTIREDQVHRDPSSS